MSLLEWVRVAEDARDQQDDERVATGLESLPGWPVGELVPLDRVALIAVDSPERARNEIRPPAGGSRREIRGRRLRPRCSATWWRA